MYCRREVNVTVRDIGIGNPIMLDLGFGCVKCKGMAMLWSHSETHQSTRLCWYPLIRIIGQYDWMGPVDQYDWLKPTMSDVTNTLPVNDAIL